MFRASRGSQGPHALRTVWLRMGLFAAGAVLAFIGMATNTSWLLYVALAVLLVGVVLRLVSRQENGEG